MAVKETNSMQELSALLKEQNFMLFISVETDLGPTREFTLGTLLTVLRMVVRNFSQR